MKQTTKEALKDILAMEIMFILALIITKLLFDGYLLK